MLNLADQCFISPAACKGSFLPSKVSALLALQRERNNMKHSCKLNETVILLIYLPLCQVLWHSLRINIEDLPGFFSPALFREQFDSSNDHAWGRANSRLLMSALYSAGIENYGKFPLF